MLNDGRGIVIRKRAGGRDVMEIDGVIVNSTVALINEAKSNLHEAHVQDVIEKLRQLKDVLADTYSYDCEPDVIKLLDGLRLVAVVSGKNYSAEAKALCEEKHVHLLESDGSG